MNAWIKLGFGLGATVMAGVGVAQGQTVLKGGYLPNNAPITFLDAKTNAASGYGIDVMNLIAKDNGFQVQYVPFATNNSIGDMFAAVSAKQIDLVAVPLTPTPERATLVDFTPSIATLADVLIVLKSDTKDYKSFADLKGMAVGSSTGTVFMDMLNAQKGVLGEIKGYPNRQALSAALSAGEIKAILGVSTQAYDLQQGLYPDQRIVKSWVPAQALLEAYSVRKGDADLLKKLNASIAKLEADGTLKALRIKWAIE